MNLMWQAEGVFISDTVSARCDSSTAYIIGHGYYRRLSDRQFRWDAMATPDGWYVTIYSFSGILIGSAQGATFNLPLEVATIVKRLL